MLAAPPPAMPCSSHLVLRQDIHDLVAKYRADHELEMLKVWAHLGRVAGSIVSKCIPIQTCCKQDHVVDNGIPAFLQAFGNKLLPIAACIIPGHAHLYLSRGASGMWTGAICRQAGLLPGCCSARQHNQGQRSPCWTAALRLSAAGAEGAESCELHNARAQGVECPPAGCSERLPHADCSGILKLP